MIYNHQAPTMSSSSKRSPRPRHKSFQQNTKSSSGKCKQQQITASSNPTDNRCRGRCRVQWSEQHVKEGLVLVQEAQLARVVKTGPISEHYEIDAKPFASGQWARVYKCRSRSTGIVYAAKYSSRNRFNADCSAELRHEIALLSLCSQSPRVVRLHDVYETPKEIIMVMEFAPGGDMQTLIDGDLVPLEGDVVHFVRQLVEGLAYLHERNIAHLDIKPQNLVMMGSFPDCNVKLCDFEISRVVLEGTEVREILGTPDYVAPEILHYEPITLAADMWSLGVTTYVLLTGFSPFGGETDQETFKNIILGQVDFPEELFEDVSAQAKDFVAKLLVLEPSARMSAKQCLRHEWLRGAPTQASAHLRKYLSKSREVLLERVVSRENLRRAALLNGHHQQAMDLSQSEMCLNRGLTGSRGSLSLPGSGSEDYESGVQDTSSSRTSLADSVSSSKSSLAMSQSCLLNKEQTEGLLNQAQDRSSLRASMAQGLNRVSLLSRISQVQSRSQACLPLLNGSDDNHHHRHHRKDRDLRYQALNGTPLGCCYFDGSREKLYGLKSLSKSQGMLDIYRSLESLQRHKRDLLRQKERSKTEDVLPIFRHLAHGSSSGSLGSASSSRLARDFEHIEYEVAKKPETKAAAEQTTPVSVEDGHGQQEMDCEAVDDVGHKKDAAEVSQEVRSTGPSSLGVSEANLDSLQSLESDTLTDDSEETSASRSLTNKQSSTGSDCHGRETDSENDEPKFTVAQLVSAFNKHQEVASRGSLEAIVSEKRDSASNFPIGPKALRLFIPDIDISERKPLVRRKTSYKPRKNWEELRKQSEKNEGLLPESKDFFNDSGNEEDCNEEQHQHDTRIDEKYKQCVQVACKTSSSETCKLTEPKKIETPPLSPSSMDSGVNLRDILHTSGDASNKDNPEKLRERSSMAKVIVAGDNSSLASKISAFSGDKRDKKRQEAKSRTAVKEKVCTGSYGRAMEKFSGKSSNAATELSKPRSRKTSATTTPTLLDS
ncbi:probable serine/threonine-protein kinase MARK-A isoform X2 [Nasonia vitripennis]|uniref:Protein kinase domain-containing protein n=1 Tax=Nasonia vitripennis TaxID=7425 RepID=A0A7M7H2M0_NASVI|nr:probable serine/threonine-protein kinase MARK-A isoform X2 [Nasonia vitripennis]